MSNPVQKSRLCSWCLYAIVVLLLFSCASSKAVFENRSEIEEWKQLYNGKNLYGWDIKFAGEIMNANYKNTFLAMDSFIRIQYNEYTSFDNKYAHMYYFEPFSHYKLKFDYRFYGEQTPGGASWNVRNSGVMFHSQSANTNEFDQHFPVSIELQLLGGLSNGKERHTGNMCSPGTNIVMNGELNEIHCIPSSSKTYDGDDWVSAELIVLGSEQIFHIIEGDTVLSYSDPQLDDNFVNQNKDDWSDFGVYTNSWKNQKGMLLESGYIALQAESHPIDFRGLQLLNLKGCMDKSAVNYKSYFVEEDNSTCLYK
jgi:hypothetical protein